MQLEVAKLIIEGSAYAGKPRAVSLFEGQEDRCA
ncbi:Unannotated [Lentimonas sp. CC19]|nr:Unannotated [Lentimonas sp. CC4]CAA6683461.1 Unannotated [Lentimonas sp. CC6]CAA6691280.1 Unannotated [Lentimonas sp. CC10]CAA6695905.1 Unannotated [Lentimonas sp. CC19]CAA7068663.1 Unannotated [Lentimonas sp. CC11]CAA7171641.1 Unannotated [Lentimonas sp. CC21]CAA7181427.1 Unannotated [Lentimonas sp. CC8]